MTIIQRQDDTARSAGTADQHHGKTLAWILRSGIMLNVALGFVYLLMLNGLATLGFDLESLKAEKLEIQKQHELMDIALAIPTSLYALESDESIQSMASVENKGYLRVFSGEVAVVDKAESGS